MTMTSKMLALFVLTAGMAAGTFAQNPASDSLTVDQAIHLAVDNHPAVQAAQAGVAAALARLQASRSGRYPDVKGEALYSRIGPTPAIDTPFGSFVLAPANNYNFHVTGREVLYDFGRLSRGFEAAQAGREAAEVGVDQVRYTLAYRTIETFYSILFLQENLGVIDEQLRILGQHMEAAQKRVRAGSATDYEVLTTQVRVSAAQGRRVDVADALVKQQTLLRQLTGLPADAPLALKGDFAAGTASSNADSLVAAALQQLPEARLSRNAEISANIRLRQAELGLRPTLNAFIDGGVKNGYEPNLNKPIANYALGLQLVAPIFNGWLTRSQKQEAQANLEASQARTRDLERQIQAGVRLALSDVQDKMAKVQTAQPQVDQAQRALQMANVRYDAGVITNLDLLDAQTALSDAQLTLLRAQYDLKISVYGLQKAIGQKVW